MQDLKSIIETIRTTVETGLVQLEEVQNQVVHVEMDKLKDNENIAGVVSKIQLLNEQYSSQMYDGLKVLNAVIAQKSKEIADRFE